MEAGTRTGGGRTVVSREYNYIGKAGQAAKREQRRRHADSPQGIHLYLLMVKCSLLYSIFSSPLTPICISESISRSANVCLTKPEDTEEGPVI